MKRPQSAKPGYRAPAVQNSVDQIRQQELSHKNLHRKHIKLLKPDLTQNDFARIMPKKIYQDKERLYSEGLQLKQKVNQIQQENIRLKTRISILEKQKDKLSKVIDVAAESNNKSQSRFKMHQGPSKASDAQNTRIRNLTKIIRQSKQENQYLKQQNAKIKKAVKFTKINQVEIECKILRQQYQKLQQLLVQMNQKLADQNQYEKQVNQLKNYLQQEVEQNKQLTEANQKYIEYIEQLENKLKKQTEKYLEREKKLQRQLALNKRRLNQATKLSQDLRKQLRALKEAPQNVQKPKPLPARNISRPMSSNPYGNKQENKQPISSDTLKKLQQMKQKNQKLQKQLKQIKQRLEISQKQNHKNDKNDNKKAVEQKAKQKKQQQPKQIISKPSQNKQLGMQSDPQQNYSNQKFDQQFVLSPQKIPVQNQKEKGKNSNFVLSDEKKNKKQQSGGNFILKQQKKASPQQQYYDQFQQQPKQSGKKKNLSPSKKKADSHLENYHKDFQEQDVQQEELFKKQTKKQKQKKHDDKQKGGKKKKTEQVKKDNKSSNFQPNKEMLSQIKQLLTYRMKAQRYPYQQLEKDILNSNEQKFSYSDLQGMMKSQPFYLTPFYTKQFLQYVFQKKNTGSSQQVPTKTLLQKLKKVIKNFQLIDEKQEQMRLMSIAEMTTQYPDQLQNAFEKIKNGPDTVARKDLVQMFKKLELADHFIQIIIAQLSLCSSDLEHLSIRGYFQRFYIDDVQNQNQNAINQQQIESSGEQKGSTNKNKIHKIDEQQQYSDDKVNFIMEDQAELSMKGKNPKGKQPDYNQQIVSDDGHI